MGITIVVGGQYGGEGKGKVSHFLAKNNNINITVRVGGSNSGHTVINEKNETLILRQLPTPSILPNSISVLSAGSYIDIDVLMKEITLTGISNEQLRIDKNAMIITKEDKENESCSTLRKDIGSTLSGTGACVKRRINRDNTTKLAKDFEILKPYISDTKEYLHQELQNGKNILIEGTQGFGLSLLHSKNYPFTTSRDTTAAGFLSEVGLSPLAVKEIVLVIRAFPIRVEGNSGKLENEISWSTLQRVPELSSVTKKERRIAEFDSRIVREAIISNNPTKIVLNHLDYINDKDQEDFVINIEEKIKAKIHLVGLSNASLENR